MKSIQKKILLVIISAMLILGISITTVSALYISSILNEDSDIITESVANTEALKINEVFGKIENRVKIMENYVVATYEETALYDAEYRAKYIEDVKQTFYVITENSSYPAGFYFRFAPELTDGTAGFYVSRTSGGSNFYEITPADLTNWKDAPRENVCWYSEPTAAGAPTWVLPYFNPNSELEIISYVIPVFINHIMIGVVGIDVEVATIANIVDNISVYDNGFAYLADNDDNIIYSAADEHTLGRAHTAHGFAEEKRDLDNGMILVVHADYSDIQRDAYRMVTIIISVVALVMICFIYITSLLTKKIVDPLKQLASAAESMADGETELDLDSCKTGDEVELVADSMKKTSDKLRGYMSYINALAYRDSLTGVKNRAAYSEAIANLDLRIGTEQDLAFAVLVADINRLKSANDHYGHEIGNQLIIKASKIICDVFKHSPVFRLGGDEFAVIMENEDYENCEKLVAEMDEKCAESFISVPGGKIEVSVARGYALFERETHRSFESVFSSADRQMYENKKTKRD